VIRPTHQFVVLALLVLLLFQEKPAHLAHQVRLPILAVLVYLVLQDKETLVPRTLVTRVLQDLVLWKEACAFVVRKVASHEKEVCVCLALLAAILTQIKLPVWNALWVPSLQTGSHVCLVHRARLPLPQERLSVYHVASALHPMRDELHVFLAKQGLVQ